MEDSSKRLFAQPRRQSPTRRTVLKLAAAASLAPIPIAAAAVDVAPTLAPNVPEAMAGYYAFLLMELAAIEDVYGIPEMHAATAAAGASRGSAMQSGSTVRQRYDWLSGFTDTRSLFTAKEA